MSESYRALSNDFYVNQKLQVKLDLPRGREGALDFCERLRKRYGGLGLLRRTKDELALESVPEADFNRWMAIKANTLRTGVVNPATLGVAMEYHRAVLEGAPLYLNVSPLDIDYVELLFGFDLTTGGNHDSIVFEALYGGSPLAGLMGAGSVVDCQPVVGLSLPVPDDEGRSSPTHEEIQGHLEVKTHPSHVRRGGPEAAPISVYLTLRRFGLFSGVEELPAIVDRLARRGERLIESVVVPSVLVPIRQAAGLGHG